MPNEVEPVADIRGWEHSPSHSLNLWLEISREDNNSNALQKSCLRKEKKCSVVAIAENACKENTSDEGIPLGFGKDGTAHDQNTKWKSLAIVQKITASYPQQTHASIRWDVWHLLSERNKNQMHSTMLMVVVQLKA